MAGAVLAVVAALAQPLGAEAREWSLKDCIDHAMQHNISLQQSRLQERSAAEDVAGARAQLFPSLSFSTSQNFGYRPWPEGGSSTVQDGYVMPGVDKASYNGSYGVNANWTVWNGGRNRNTVTLNQLNAKKAEADTQTAAESIQERIAQLYVQILYSTEAVKVNEESLATSRKNEERGREMLDVGKMSQADLAQLTAQRAQDEYNVVAAQAACTSYKRQLKEVLQLTDTELFDAVPGDTDAEVLAELPSLADAYAAAEAHRPELRSAQLGIDASRMSVKIAKAGRMPVIGVNAGLGTNTSTMSQNGWGTQMKSNLNFAAGVSVSVPIFDNRSTRTAVNKANIQLENSQLALRDKQTQLWSNMENYWTEANTNQAKYRASRVSVESAQQSYDKLSEQFALGLKNIVELMTGKDNLMAAKQNALQSKYMALLNIHLLEFYQNGEMK